MRQQLFDAAGRLSGQPLKHVADGPHQLCDILGQALKLSKAIVDR